MNPENISSGYGAAKLMRLTGTTTGKTFYVTDPASANNAAISGTFRQDKDGVLRVYATPTLALAACVTGRGDIVYLDPAWVTALTAAELLSAEAKGVVIVPAGNDLPSLLFFEDRATAALPQGATGHLFTVTGMIKLLDIIGTVTTVIQTQTNATKITATPTVGSAVDLCATKDISAAAVGTVLSITGTLATAMQQNTNGIFVAQAAPIMVPAGTIDLITGASNTGSIKWKIRYQQVDPGAFVVAA